VELTVFTSIFPKMQIAIACHLEHSSIEMVRTMAGEQRLVMDAIRIACYFFSGTIAACSIPAIVVWISHEFCTIRVIELVQE